MRSDVYAMFLTALTTCVLGGAMPADGADGKNLVRFGAAFVSPTGDLTTDGFFVEDVDVNTRLEFQGNLTIEPDDTFGFWFDYERRFTDMIGLDVALLFAGHDVEGSLDGTAFLIDNATNTILEQETLRLSEDIADIDVMPLVVGANFHLIRKRAFDLYVGPSVAYVMYGDLEFEDESVDIDDDVAFGAVAGIDVPLGAGHWVFNGSLRYMKTGADPKESGPDSMELDVDPWIVLVGAGRRF